MSPSAEEPTRVWVPTPPGWVELAAFETDTGAEEHWRAVVEPVRGELGDGHTEELYRVLRTARAAVTGTAVSSAGLVLTAVAGEMAVWSFSTVVEHIPSGDLNPAALLERSVAGSVESVEDVTLPGHRTGVLARFTTPAVDEPQPQPALHHCVVAAPLPRRARDLVVVSGSSAVVGDPDLFAMAAVSIAAGVAVGTAPADAVAPETATASTGDPAGPHPVAEP